MTNRLPIQRCQYCGCEDIGLGWQHGEALVTFKKHGMLGNRLRYLICRRCGALPVCGGALQVSSSEIGCAVTTQQMKLNDWR